MRPIFFNFNLISRKITKNKICHVTRNFRHIQSDAFASYIAQMGTGSVLKICKICNFIHFIKFRQIVLSPYLTQDNQGLFGVRNALRMLSCVQVLKRRRWGYWPTTGGRGVQVSD